MKGFRIEYFMLCVLILFLLKGTLQVLFLLLIKEPIELAQEVLDQVGHQVLDLISLF